MATRIDFAVLVRLVLKLIGLGMVMFALVGIATALSAGLAAMFDDLDYPSGAQTFYLLGASPAVLLVAGLLLWLFPSPVANTVIADAPVVGAEWPGWTLGLQTVLLLVLGLYFVIDGASAMVYGGVYQFVVSGQAQTPVTRDGQMIASLAGNAVQAGLGLLLILGRRGLLASLHRLREMGLHDSDK